MTTTDMNAQTGPPFIRLSREDFFRSHPLNVSILVTSYDSLELDNVLAKQSFALIRFGNGRSVWSHHFVNHPEAVRQLFTGGACVVIEIQITHSAQFGLDRNLRVEWIAPAVTPPPNDFRYAYLTQGDFVIHCTDGRVLAQRSHLYVSSEYFGRLLDQNPSLSSHFLSYPKKLVAALVGYIHTLTFAFPERTCLEDMEPFLRLLDQLMLRNDADRMKLRNAAEVWITYRFVSVQKNLREVVRCLCTASEEDFTQMVIPACNFLVNEHYETFADTYKPNTDDHRVWALLPKLSRSSDSDAYWMLDIRDEAGFSPMAYIKRMRAKSSFTRLMWTLK
ncbi:hypothetical protein AAVH_02172 [Aphelenchoides avenae]|nr:hypothetical protein AAVH_02172 [Aphelenchus avenae]